MTVKLEAQSAHTKVYDSLDFLWLEITGRCNLVCSHCYAESGPDGSEDTVGVARWMSLLEEAAALGVAKVQFIGGEPTLHPHLDLLINRARQLEIAVEIFSNLTHVPDRLWSVICEREVSLATSFYSRSESVHDAITRGRGSHSRTLASIKKALELGVPLRVGIVDLAGDEQDAQDAARMLGEMGVAHVTVDGARAVGRARAVVPVGDHADPVASLCGHCAVGKLAVTPDGTVYPCVFSRWLPVGNILIESLIEISRGRRLQSVRRGLSAAFNLRVADTRMIGGCGPDRGDCNPNMGDCVPFACNPQSGCNPYCFPWH